MRIYVLLWLVSLSCLFGLGEVMAGGDYADYRFRNYSQYGPLSQEDRYRWRPLNEDEQRSDSPAEPYRERLQTPQRVSPPPVIDYAETPPGLPRGVYRPVEERHNITPHMEGFRFRTLSPSEQRRIKRRNEEYNQSVKPNRSESRKRLSSDGYGGFDTDRQQDYRFRPDERLDKRRSGNWGRSYTYHPNGPAFTETYQTPVYRLE